MKRYRGLSAAAITLTLIAASAYAAPARVMSIDVCTDQLVLALLPPARITSVTWLSRDPADSILWRQARGVPINHGLGEEVVRDKPDLVVGEPYSVPPTAALLRRMGARLIEVTSADTWEDIRRETRQLAAAFEVPARGEALIAHLDRALALGKPPAGPPIRVAAWDGAGFSARPGTLYDTLVRAAGAINVANQPPASGYARPDAEVLLAAAPDMLLEGEPAFNPPNLQDNGLNHPVVRRFWYDRVVVVPAAFYMCGTPYSADGLAALEATLRGTLAHAQPWPPNGAP